MGALIFKIKPEQLDIVRIVRFAAENGGIQKWATDLFNQSEKHKPDWLEFQVVFTNSLQNEVCECVGSYRRLPEMLFLVLAITNDGNNYAW